MDTSYDVIVIGAGAVGENAAHAAALGRLDVAIVESALVGGECSYWACMPSKTLLRPGEALEAARRSPGADGAVTGEMDVTAALERRNRMVHHWNDSSQVKWLEREGIHLIRGRARLTGELELQVTTADDTHSLRARKAVVIATGSQNILPEIPGIEEVGVWDSRDATSAQTAPESMLFVGGGTVGAEMAQAWAWLGSRVTIVHRSEHLLSPEEPFAGAELAAALERMGVEVFTNADTTALARPRPDGPATATVRLDGGAEREIEAGVVVAAVGRRAQSKDLGLDSVGLEPGSFLEVNQHMQVEGVDGGWLYAVGDVNGRALLTHMGKYQARIAGAHIGGHRRAAVSAIPSVPRVIFTSPEVAAVGLTEQEARTAGIDVVALTYDIGKVAGAATLGKGYSGTVKLVVDGGRQVVVGATFVGPRVGELLHAATIAIVGEVPLETLWHAVPSFPTLSEVWLRLLEGHRDNGWDPYG